MANPLSAKEIVRVNVWKAKRIHIGFGMFGLPFGWPPLSMSKWLANYIKSKMILYLWSR